MANTVNNRERYEGRRLPGYFVGRMNTLSKGKEGVLTFALFNPADFPAPVVTNESLFNPNVARFPLPPSYTPELTSPAIPPQPQPTAAAVPEAAQQPTVDPQTSADQQSDLSVERALAEVYGIHDGRDN